MSSEPFPLFRLGTLLLRQLSAPLASRIKEYAKCHPTFSREVCMRSGRVVAAAELRFKLWTLRVPAAAARAAPALSDQRALDAGADILGEVIIFTLGATILIFEFNRQAMKQETKVAAEASAWLAVRLQVEELRREVDAQQRDMDRLADALRRAADRPAPAPIPATATAPAHTDTGPDQASPTPPLLAPSPPPPLPARLQTQFSCPDDTSPDMIPPAVVEK